MTEKQALRIAKKKGLEEEVKESIKDGLSPEKALEEWDLCTSRKTFREYYY